MRIIGQGWRLGALVAASLILTSGALQAGDAPAVVHVKAAVQNGVVRLEAQANAPFEYATYRPSKSLYVVDMTGVSAGDEAGARVVASELIKSYRVVSYTAGQKPVVRLEILLSAGVEPRIERQDAQDLALLVERTTGAAPATNPTTSAAPAVVPVAAKASEASNRGAGLETIQQVSIAQNGDQTQVRIFGTGPLDCHATRLQNPDRIVLDFAGSHLGAPAGHHIASNLNPVREIRMAQFTPEVSRVVIDLRSPSAYKVDAAGNSLTVSFAPAATGAAEAAPTARASSVTTTEEQPSKNSNVEETASAAPAQIPAPAAVLPVAFTQPASAFARPAVAQMQPQATAAATQAAENASAAASQSGNAAPPAPESQPSSAEPAQTPEAQSPTPAPSSRYSGEPISVNLKDVDLRDFFRLIHEISGLNVVVDPAVKGTLTIVLEDVPWDQALDIVLHNNDLDKQLDGNVLRIATKETLRKEADENRDLIKAQEDAVGLITTTRTLSYTKATPMASLLKKFLSSRGDILPDVYSNSLVIRDVPSTLPVIDNLIRQLDRKSMQVEIEARVVEADRNFSRQLGTILSLSGASGNSALGGTSAVGTSEISFTPAPPIFVGSPGAKSGPAPSVFNLGATGPTSGLQYLFASKNFALDFVIDAAESRGVGKLLSEPKVITQNNQKASVKQGVKIPIQTDVNNTISLQYVDAVLELDVTPQITAEGTIYMEVTIENDQPNNAITVQGTPEVITQSADTKVTVDDGATVVIGGIIVTNQTTAVDQVPVLGSIPLLGDLFKHTTVSSTSKELLFFITPRILPS